MDLKTLHPQHGQSIWLDYIRRHLIESGELRRLVEEDGLRGVTSNPSIFAKAMGGSTDYDRALDDMDVDHDATPKAIYESLAIEDIQHAADILRPVYDEAAREDGYVSMEVSPYLAHDTAGTVEEARRLWRTLDRPNVMIKVPATTEGLSAIEQLTAEGINVNVTLLFSREVWAQVADAYMSGLEALAERGGDLSEVASVASLFVSRLDVLVAPRLEADTELRHLDGKVAIANAKLTYRDWKATRAGARWRALEARGAHVQRLLWASTSTKDPRLSDVLYVESLIGPDTVDTIPPATLDAFRDHGEAANRVEADLDDAEATLATLATHGVDLDALTDELLVQGVDKFSEAFDGLMASVEQKREGALRPVFDRMRYRLPAPLEDDVKTTLSQWHERTGSAASGRGTRRCGPARTRAGGSTGSASPRTSATPSRRPRPSSKTRGAALRTRSCSAWAGRACARTSCRASSSRRAAARGSSSSTRPIRRRSARSRRRSTSARRSSSSRASPARPSSRTS